MREKCGGEMIRGIGVDLVELTRIREIMEKNQHSFIQRVLTKKEEDFFDNLKSEGRKLEYLAGRFAAKEAISKAFGTGIGTISFHDLEIINDDRGQPLVTLYGKAADIARVAAIGQVWVSISHSNNDAIAQAILESQEV